MSFSAMGATQKGASDRHAGAGAKGAQQRGAALPTGGARPLALAAAHSRRNVIKRELGSGRGTGRTILNEFWRRAANGLRVSHGDEKNKIIPTP